MGRQIAFHMLDDDAERFFHFLNANYPIVVTPWSSDTPTVGRSIAPARETGRLALWEQLNKIEPNRKMIERIDGTVAYEFDRSISVLEFSPSRITSHEQLPALMQGRLYSFLSDMGPETSNLYLAARRWIERSFEPCPMKLLGGRIGPAAMRWYRDGGILLPMFNPPSTQAWKDFIRSQHRDTTPIQSDL